LDKAVVVEELKRVAETLNTKRLSRSTFVRHGTLSSAAIESAFGSWNEAILAAGLTPFPQGGIPKEERRRAERISGPLVASRAAGVSDADLLDDLMRVAKELGRRPSGNQLTAKGKYGRDVYVKRWGSVAKAYEAATKRT
jgi:hypothetical protein